MLLKQAFGIRGCFCAVLYPRSPARSAVYRYRATAETWMAVPRYRRVRDRTTALPRALWHDRGLGASIACPQMLGCLAGLAHWLLSGFYRGPSTALPRISGTYYRATEPCGIPRTALPRACGSTTAGDLAFGSFNLTKGSLIFSSFCPCFSNFL